MLVWWFSFSFRSASSNFSVCLYTTKKKDKKQKDIICFYRLDNICDALHDLFSFVQFKKLEKHPWRSVTFSLQLSKEYHSFMVVFKVFKIVQMLPNCAKHLIQTYQSNCFYICIHYHIITFLLFSQGFTQTLLFFSFSLTCFSRKLVQ